MTTSEKQSRSGSTIASSPLLAESVHISAWVNLWIRVETNKEGAGELIFHTRESARCAALEWCKKYPKLAHTYLATKTNATE